MIGSKYSRSKCTGEDIQQKSSNAPIQDLNKQQPAPTKKFTDAFWM